MYVLCILYLCLCLQGAVIRDKNLFMVIQATALSLSNLLVLCLHSIEISLTAQQCFSPAFITHTVLEQFYCVDMFHCRVKNSVKCSRPINSSLRLCDFVSHYKNILLSFNINLQNHFTKLVNSILPIRINQSQVLLVESGVILWALKQVNKSESLDSDGLCFKFFAYDCPELLKHLQLLFQMCLAQSVVPDSFLSSCIAPIVKRGKDPSACSNYHPITVSCFVSKLFEYVLLPVINSKCNFILFQLGFRKGMGCVQTHHIVGRLYLVLLTM